MDQGGVVGGQRRRWLRGLATDEPAPGVAALASTFVQTEQSGHALLTVQATLARVVEAGGA